ncbi:MAG: NAD(P)/FAD-dependent oxidoreductase [Armatimonadetes bacterium]|nr:NAD(P)/FAD-dependent oxidoreductase [Armatimonadota bacterium]
MAHYKYLILGGGMAADAAVKAIREIDRDGSIGLISAEPDPPYKRPPLSKKLWQGKPEDIIWLKTEEMGVDMHLGCIAKELDPMRKTVTEGRGAEYTYDKLLLATGGTPRKFPFDSGSTIFYRTVQDYHKLRDLANRFNEFAVIGGGFIGTEIAAALAMNGKRVTMVLPESYIGAKLYPRDLAKFLTDYYRQKGVNVMPGETVSGVEVRGGRTIVFTQTGHEVMADGAVAGLGITPNMKLAEGAGLKVENGIHVDDCLRTNNPDIYAAGDVAVFYNPALAKHVRVEHEDNAVTMGAYAGKSMAGQGEPYHHLPYFYSDLFDLGYEAVGELDSRLETVEDWKEPFKEGVVYYMREGRVTGVLLWNVWDKVPAARELIAERGPFKPEDLKGRILNVEL